MAIDSTYRRIIINDYIKDSLSRGVVLSASDVQDQVLTLLNTLDLTVPQFLASTYHVEEGETSSVSKYTNTFTVIRQDLNALYQEMIALTKTSLRAAERWQLESSTLEKRLIDLEERIDDLLITIQDVSPQQGIIVDNFTDMNLIDKTLTTADVDLKSTTVTLGRTNTDLTKIFLNDLDPTQDVRFSIRTKTGFLSRVDAENTTIANPFKQNTSTWWTSINAKSIKPMVCEYLVKISADDPVSISKIFIELHDSVEASPVVITPLYSIDNVNFSQLPTNTFTQEVRNITTFSFSEVEAKWVKFIIVKQGPDLSSSTSFFSYQFGFKEISFYAEAYSASTNQQLYSQPLYLQGSDGLPVEFEKLTLETCERIETDTNILYFVTTSNDSSVTVDGDTIWTPISPINRATPIYPTLLTVGNIEEGVIGDDEDVQISTDVAGGFELISDDGTGTIQTTTETSSTTDRYTYKNTNDRILNHQIKDQDYSGSGDDYIQLNEKTLTFFRNVGEQSLNPSTAAHKVRDVQRGWSFEDPYYTTVVRIDNPEGITINVGDFPIIVDDVQYTNKVDETVLTGKSGDNTGIHKVKVHKSRWKHVGAGETSLADLITADNLYPYNHKLLIEGYDYSGFTSDTEEQIYQGVDLFAEYLMTKVSPFDIYNNVKEDNYSVYAFDKDAPGTHVAGNAKPTKVILVKVDLDDPNTDFQNEKFVLNFTRINQLKKYLRIRADFSTLDTKITPALHAYKIKLA